MIVVRNNSHSLLKEVATKQFNTLRNISATNIECQFIKL